METIATNVMKRLKESLDLTNETSVKKEVKKEKSKNILESVFVKRLIKDFKGLKV